MILFVGVFVSFFSSFPHEDLYERTIRERCTFTASWNLLVSCLPAAPPDAVWDRQPVP